MTARPLAVDATLSVAERMRESDRREIFALMWPGFDTPALLAAEVCRVSRWGATIHDSDGIPQAAVGLAPLHPGVCSAWMFATDRWPDVWPAVAAWVKGTLIPGALAAGIWRSEARVAADNEPALKFLRWCGFRAESEPAPFGRGREPYMLMARLDI